MQRAFPGHSPLFKRFPALAGAESHPGRYSDEGGGPLPTFSSIPPSTNIVVPVM
jgi:hypothetical protein